MVDTVAALDLTDKVPTVVSRVDSKILTGLLRREYCVTIAIAGSGTPHALARVRKMNRRAIVGRGVFAISYYPSG
jgi:hypothetical protein